jgi:hypothetical protein
MLSRSAGRVGLRRSSSRRLSRSFRSCTRGDAFGLTTPSPVGPIVSWPRVYADLKRLGGRGDDAAEHLRDVIEQERG